MKLCLGLLGSKQAEARSRGGRGPVWRAKEIGVNYIGACCGGVAAHIREMARIPGKLPGDNAAWRVDYERPMSYEY